MSSNAKLDRALIGLSAQLGSTVRDERLRRGWSLRSLADRAGISPSLLQWLETGHAASLESYVRVGAALGLRADFRLVDARRREGGLRDEDPVHAAMGELFATRLARPAFGRSLDEPFQHFQFAGRADVVAWSIEDRALLHIENRTRFPNLQESFGSYNAKRRYLPAVMAERCTVRGGWRSVTHVVAALWSAEVLHAVRMHRSSFDALCPDGPEALDLWLDGKPPSAGTPSSLVLVDPAARPRQRLYVGRESVDTVRPRYSGYAEAVRALSAGA
jgi:transcriptional regulator with XRE-family HTH domain